MYTSLAIERLRTDVDRIQFRTDLQVSRGTSSRAATKAAHDEAMSLAVRRHADLVTLVVGALTRTDGDEGPTFDSRVNEGVPGKCAFSCHLPVEQLRKELSSRVRV